MKNIKIKGCGCCAISIIIILTLIMSGCKPEAQVITVENAEQITWGDVVRITNNESLAFLEWSAIEEGEAFVSGFMKTQDGFSGFIYKCNVNDIDREGNLLKYSNGFGDFRDFSVSPNGKIMAVCSFSGVIYIFNMNKNYFGEDYWYTIEGHPDSKVNSVDWSVDGTLLASGGDDDVVRIWNMGDEAYQGVEKNSEIMSIEVSSNVLSVSFAPEGEILIIASETGISAIDLLEKSILFDMSGAPLGQLATVLKWSPDFKSFAAGTFDGKVFIIPYEDRNLGNQIDFHDISNSGYVRGLAYSPDGEMLAVVFSNAIIIWDLAGKQVLKRLSSGDSLSFTDILWSPDGLLISVYCSDGCLRLLEVKE